MSEGTNLWLPAGGASDLPVLVALGSAGRSFGALAELARPVAAPAVAVMWSGPKLADDSVGAAVGSVPAGLPV